MELSELATLNKAQRSAWNSMKRAHKKCLDANICFYQNLETLYAINGDYIESVVSPANYDVNAFADDLDINGEHDRDGINIGSSFADDTHYAVLTRAGVELFNDDVVLEEDD